MIKQLTDKNDIDKYLKEKQKSFQCAIRDLRKYYKEETIQKFIDLICAKEAVFSQNGLWETQGRHEVFFEIAKQNIFKRTIDIIENIPDIDPSKLDFKLSEGNLSINYRLSDNIIFSIFNCNLNQQMFRTEKNPYINLYFSVFQARDISVEDILCSNTHHIYEQLEKECSNSSILEFFFQKYDDLTTMDYVKQMELLIRGKICNQVTEALIKDWGDMNFESQPDSDDMVRKLSWVNISKRRIEEV